MALCASSSSVGRADWLVSDVNIYHTRELPKSCVSQGGVVGVSTLLISEAPFIMLCWLAFGQNLMSRQCIIFKTKII